MKSKIKQPFSIDEQIRAIEARIRVLKGEKINQDSRKLIERLDEHDFVEYSKQLPRSVVLELLGKTSMSSIDHAAKRFGLPLTGRRLNLASIVQSLFDRLSVLSSSIDPTQVDEDETFRRQLQKLELEQISTKNANINIDLKERQGQLIERSEVRKRLKWLTSQLQALGKRLYRCKTGNDAQTIMNEFLETLQAEQKHGGSLHV